MSVISSESIFFGLSPIPNTLGPPILLIIIYLLISIDGVKSKLLAFLFMMVMVLMHTISAFISVLVIFLGFLLTTIYSGYYGSKDAVRSIRPISLTITLFFAVFMFSWWLYVSGSFVSFLGSLQWGFNVDNFISEPVLFNSAINAIPLLERIFDNIGLYILSALSLVGSFLMINKKFRNNETFFLAITGLILLAIAFTSNFLGAFIVPERWYYFAFVILSIPLAITFVIISNKMGNNILFSILTFFIAFALIINPVANVDNHELDPNSVFTTALTESELTAINSTETFWNSTIATDQYYGFVINDLGYGNAFFMDDNIYYENFNNQSKTLVLIRNQNDDRTN